jgi:hypothetical protein
MEEQYYKELEQVVDQLGFNFNNPIIDLFEKYRKEVDEQSELLQKIKFEVDINSVVISNNTLNPKMSGTDENGNPIEYPPFRQWNEKAFDYIRDRLNTTKNKYLKIRYAMLLWHSKQKHRDYANIAIETYLELFQEVRQQIIDADDRKTREKFESIIYNLIPLAISINHSEISNIKSDFVETLKEIKTDGKNKFLVSSMIYTMLEYPKLFKQAKILEVKPLIETILSNLVSEHDKIRICELAIKLEQKTNGQKEKWLRKIGTSYETLSFQREDDTKIAAFSFCKDALSVFKELKDQDKIQELSLRYDYLKKNMKLGKFSKQIDVTEIVNQRKAQADKITESEPIDIFRYISNSDEVVPSYTSLKESAKEKLDSNGFEKIVSKSVIDSSGHISETFNSDEEKIKSIMIESADFKIKYDLDILIQEICYNGIKKSKISLSSFEEYFKKESWLGMDLSRILKQGDKEDYNWIELILPSFENYLALMQKIIDQVEVPNFILAIDSLTLKIEGIIRDICHRIGVSTINVSKSKTGQKVIREKDVNILLHEPKLIEFLSEDDLFFLKYLLIEKAGKNLRNKIAHTLLIHKENYHIGLIHLVLIAIFKLGKEEYTTKIKEKATDNNR